MGVHDQPAILIQGALDFSLYPRLVPAARLQRNRIELRQVHAAGIDTRMHAADGRKTRRIEALGAGRDPAIGKGVADRRIAAQKGCPNIAGATDICRDLDWDGSDHAGISIKAVANYTPGNGEKVHVTGDPQVLAHLRLRKGMIEEDCHGWKERDRDVVITLPGRHFEKFVLTGTGKLNLDRLDQPRLLIKMAGVATITANGKVHDLRINMAGVSKADFAQVTGRKVKVQMAGVNSANIGPGAEADVSIAGPSEVTLHSNPPKLDTQIMGPGRIHKVGSGS